MQEERECYITQSTTRLHKHHIFGGTANRRLSEEFGLWIWLRADWHVGTPYSIHNNPMLMKRIQREGQLKAMECYGWSEADFRKVFGRSFL